MVDDNDDEDGLPLSRESFINKMNEEIETLSKHLVFTGVENFELYHKFRGKILAYKHAKEIFLNKKK